MKQRPRSSRRKRSAPVGQRRRQGVTRTVMQQRWVDVLEALERQGIRGAALARRMETSYSVLQRLKNGVTKEAPKKKTIDGLMRVLREQGLEPHDYNHWVGA